MSGISGMRRGEAREGKGTERYQIDPWTFCELGISCNGLGEKY